MPPEKITYYTEQSNLRNRTDKVEICSGMEIMDFLREVADREFTNYYHIFCDEPGENSNFGIHAGKLRALFSDGWLESLGPYFHSDRTVRFFGPIFGDATYVAQIRTPIEDVEEIIRRHSRTVNAQVVIISKYHAKDIRRMFKEAGIEKVNLTIERGRLI